MRPPIKFEEFVKRAREVHGNKYVYDERNYTKISQHVLIECPEHGTFTKLGYEHVRGHGCPSCATGNSVPFDVFIREANAVHANKYTYSRSSYKALYKDVRIKCPVHGVFSKQAKKHLAGQGCQECSRVDSKIPFTEFLNRAKTMHGNKYTYDEKSYSSITSDTSIHCSVHGTFVQKAINHAAGHGCPKCRIQNAKLTKDAFLKLARAKHGTRYSYDFNSYQNLYSPVTVICKKHGPFQQLPTNHLHNGHGCPKCSFGKQKSSIEVKVAKWLSQYEKVSVGDRSLIAPKELDILVPKKKLAIEINGLFWHNEDHKSKNYHYEKMELCVAKGYHLVQLWEKELLEKAAICKSLLLHKLGHSKSIGARKLAIEEIDSARAKEFFNATHLQGFRGAKVYLALTLNKKIYAAMSFGLPANKKFEWELIRYSCARFTSVVGGASRLLKHFENSYAPKNLLTFADLRISQGNLYDQLGFTFLHKSRPNYIWTKSGVVLSRYKTQKAKLRKLLGAEFNSKESEVKNMQRCSWSRVFDAGNLVFAKIY